MTQQRSFMSVLGNVLGTNTKEESMTTYTQDQIGTLKSAISIATIELRAAWDLLAAPSASPHMEEQPDGTLIEVQPTWAAPSTSPTPPGNLWNS